MRTPALRTASCPSPITHHGGIMGQVRRVVTGHDNNGKAIVISDGPAPIHTNPLRPGQISHEIWKTKESPIPIDRNEADPVAGPQIGRASRRERVEIAVGHRSGIKTRGLARYYRPPRRTLRSAFCLKPKTPCEL